MYRVLRRLLTLSVVRLPIRPTHKYFWKVFIHKTIQFWYIMSHMFCFTSMIARTFVFLIIPRLDLLAARHQISISVEKVFFFSLMSASKFHVSVQHHIAQYFAVLHYRFVILFWEVYYCIMKQNSHIDRIKIKINSNAFSDTSGNY